MVYASQSYWHKKWPPQGRTFIGMMRVIKNMAQAHRSSYRILKTVTPAVPVGFSKHLVAYIPEKAGHFDDWVAVKLPGWWFNHRFFSLTNGAYDFIGVNYYFPRKQRVQVFPPKLYGLPWSGPKTDLDWPIFPKGLHHVLLHMKQYKKPVYITENGLADVDDSQRSDFIRDHIREMKRAINDGVDVRGYLHWSLLDNFEWADGFKPRFGLVAVDYDTMKRTPRPSAYVLKAFTEHVG